MIKRHKYIETFCPYAVGIKPEHKDLLCNFDCGKYQFNSFISSNEVYEFASCGEGATYIVFDKINEDNRRVVAYYTLASTSIPFISRIRIDREERKKAKKKYDEEVCGIPTIEIKMFAVDREYQNIFFELKEKNMPVSAWILEYIVDSIMLLSNEIIGAKAIFLHSLPDAEKFYKKNRFKIVEKNMIPLSSDDDDLQAMYLPMKKINMVYEK